MNDLQIGQPWQTHWIWVVCFCVLLAVFALFRQRRDLRRFAAPHGLAKRLVSTSLVRDILVGLMAVTTMLLMMVCLVDLRWGKVWREVPQKGIEVIFVLDVSRSMLAEDVSPNRLERAKQQISDAIDEMPGDRVGLILFSGEVRQQIPLTNHYEDFRQRLRNVGPEDIARGGSRLGDAIRVASGAFLNKSPNHKAIVILTDGEDMESEPVAAARAAKSDQGIRIFCIGLGDPTEGARVPARTKGRFVRYQGVDVRSKMNGAILEQIAQATDGAYIPAGTKKVDMAQVYHGYIATIEKGEFETARINRYEARFQWFLGAAIALLIAELWWSSRVDSRHNADENISLALGTASASAEPSEPNSLRSTSASTADRRAASVPGSTLVEQHT